MVEVRDTSFVHRGTTRAYDLGKASQGWWHVWDFAGIVLGDFPLLLKHDFLSIWDFNIVSE